MNEKFTPTHKIIADGETILVQEFDGEDGKILTTKGEFVSDDISDWTLNANGELEFQGSVIYPYKSVRLIKLS